MDDSLGSFLVGIGIGLFFGVLLGDGCRSVTWEQRVVDKGYGKRCFGGKFQWIDESCEEDVGAAKSVYGMPQTDQ